MKVKEPSLKKNDFVSTLVITTYNKPEFLRLTLEYVRRLKILPSEVIIADDGSGPATAKVISDFKNHYPGVVKHVWHEDKGFRLAAIRNRAIEAADGDYIIFIDGDIQVHPEFIADHIRWARQGAFVTGSRCNIEEKSTKELMRVNPAYLPPFNKLVRNIKSFHIPVLTKLFYKRKSKDPEYIRGCNMAFWKRDLIAVNGFNEDIEGWGHEDTELSWRLVNNGLKKRYLKYSAICAHLFHGRNKDNHSANGEKMAYARDNNITRIANGIVK